MLETVGNVCYVPLDIDSDVVKSNVHDWRG